MCYTVYRTGLKTPASRKAFTRLTGFLLSAILCENPLEKEMSNYYAWKDASSGEAARAFSFTAPRILSLAWNAMWLFFGLCFLYVMVTSYLPAFLVVLGLVGLGVWQKNWESDRKMKEQMALHPIHREVGYKWL